MEKEQIVILEERGIISVSGEDVIEFLQNIITNDIKKVTESRSIFAALLSPQGKYLFEFFIIKSKNGFILDCDIEIIKDLIFNLNKYKLRSKVEIKDVTKNFVIGLISLEKFKSIQKSEENNNETLIFRDSPVFIDPREKKLGARILSNLEKLYLTIKKLNLKIVKIDEYLEKAHLLGIPIKGLTSLENKLFGLEANFEKLNAIDFKKGCYIGQENTSRIKLRNKLRRRILPIKKISGEIMENDIIKYKDSEIGKIMIDKPYSFALIKVVDPDLKEFANVDLACGKSKVRILKPDWI